MAGRRPLAPGELGSVTVTRQGTGSYTARAWTRTAGGDRKRLRATGATEEDVREQLAAQARGYLFVEGVLGPDSTMAAALASWVEDRHGHVRPQTLRIYRDTVRWLSPMIGAMPLSDMRPAVVKRILQDVRRARGDGAVAHARTALSGAFGVAVEDEALDSNPLLSLRRQSQVRPIPKSLTVDQIQALRSVILEREHRIARYTGASGPLLRWVVEVMLGSGLRISEVLAIRHQDIDWENHRLEVTGTIIDDPDDWHLVRQDELKGRGQARFIDVPQFVLDALAEARSSTSSITARQPGMPAIQGRAEGQIVSARNIRRSLRDVREAKALVSALRQTGLIPEDVTPHLLRRTAATLVAAATGDLRSAQALLGHADERTTKNHYAGAAFKVVGSADVLQSILGRPSA